MSGEQEQFQQEPSPGTQPESAEQPILENVQEEAGDESRTSETQQEESDEQKAARLVKEAQLRDRREKNRLQAERRLLEKERDTYRQVVERFMEQQDRGKPAPAQETQQAPTRDFNPETGKPFETYDEFVEARAAWKAEQKAMQAVERRMEEAAQAFQKQLRQVEVGRTRQEHGRRMEEYAKQNPDFEEVAARDDIEIPTVAGTILEQMSNGPALIHIIAQQPQIAATLRGMDSPLQMAAYLGQLSQWASSSRSSKISNAAPAGRTVGSKPASSSTPPDDPDEYERWAKKKFG